MNPKSAATAPASGRLSRESIVDAAAELFEEKGFEALTMRRLAERLGVGAMTLYGYFETKEQLLAALADRALADVELPAAKARSWQQEVTEVFGSVRNTFLRHPELAQIVATQPIDGTAAYRGAEVVFAAFEKAGLSDDEAVAAFEALTSFTAGFTLRETARAAGAGSRANRKQWIQDLPSDEFERVIGLAGLLAGGDPEARFERGLAILIAGIESEGGS